MRGTVVPSRNPSGTLPSLNPKAQPSSSGQSGSEGRRKANRCHSTEIPFSALGRDPSTRGMPLLAKQGPLQGRRWVALGFSPFKAQIAEIEEIPGQAERSFKQTLYNRL